MQHNIFTIMRSWKIMDGCKGTQAFAINPSGTTPTNGGVGDKIGHSRVNSVRSRSNWSFQAPNQTGNNALVESLLPYELPSSDLLEPQIEPCLKTVDFVETLADVYRRIENCPQFEKSKMYVEQCAIFRGMSDPKLFWQSLRSAWQHAVEVHTKVVLAAWFRCERREDELVGSSSMTCCGRNVECPKASLVAGYDLESVYEEDLIYEKIAD